MNSSCQQRRNHWITFGLLIVLFPLILAGCSDGGDRKASGGSLALKTTWPQPLEDSGTTVVGRLDSPTDVCAAYGIETITAKIIDVSDTEISRNSWPCALEGRRGTIDKVPVGTDYRVVIEGTVAGAVRWRGEQAGIAINENQTTILTPVLMGRHYHVVAATSAGGRIAPADRVIVASGGELSLTWSADSAYAIADVVVDGTSVGIMENYTFPDISADHTLYVQFTPVNGTAAAHTITAAAGDGGSIVPQGGIDVVAGNNQQFTFLPAEYSHIVDVVVDGESQGAIPSYTFEDVASDHTISVSFNTKNYTINASAGNGGTIEPAGETNAPIGSTPVYTITTDTGFYLSQLLVNGQAVTAQNTYRFDPVAANKTIEAVFRPVRYVAADATNGGNGLTWQNAYQTLEAAIAAAGDNGTIWVKAGTYLLETQINVNRRVSIYGGFSGVEQFIHQRDWDANPVIFDGQAKTRGLFISSDALIDGIIVQNCTITGAYPDLQGGALFISESAPSLVNCTFKNNAIQSSDNCNGGAGYAVSSSPVFENVRFESNDLSCRGNFGGALVLNNCSTRINNSQFINNEIGPGPFGDGGAIWIRGGAAVIENSEFTANSARTDRTSGGAIATSGVDLTISGCIFVRNTANGSSNNYGGALSHGGSATAVGSVIRNAIFLSNIAGSATSIPTSAEGGALYNKDANPRIVNCTFFGNRAIGGGTANGGAICNHSSSPTITNTILRGNDALKASHGGVLDGNGYQVYDDDASSSTVTYSLIHQSGYDGQGNFTRDPKLDGSGHLRPDSACIDMGDDSAMPATDIDGETRPENGRSDIGADEFVDTDGDQMPDYWETRYGLDIGVDDSRQDLDGDRLSNIYEYQNNLNPTQASLTIDAQERGWYDQSGAHDAADNSTRCGFNGSSEDRAYFIFNLPAIEGAIQAVILRLELVDYQSIRETESFGVYDTVTDPDTIEAGAQDGEPIWQDLGEGNRLSGHLRVSQGDVGNFVNVVMSTDGVNAIKNSLGGRLAVGIKTTSFYAQENHLFSFSDGSESRSHQLVLIME